MLLTRPLLFALILVTPIPLAAADFFFRDGDKVVMLGGSVTEYRYNSYLEGWVLTRFPAWTTSFVSVGIQSDDSPGGSRRFQRDVLGHQATALTVEFGVNDGGNYRHFDADRFKVYLSGLASIAEQARAAKIRVAWLAPTPVERYEGGPHGQGYNLTLEKFAGGIQQVAAESGGVFVDQFHPYVAILDKVRTANPQSRLNTDWLRPDPPAQAFLAYSILKGLNFPRLVAAVEIDAASGKLVTAQNCHIEDLQVGPNGGLEFRQLDAALPFFPAEAKDILKWASILEELNDYRMKISGLKAGRYEVRLGGKKIAEYSAAALGAGVNLAPAVLESGPIADQVKAVWDAITAKNVYFHQRIFHGVVIPYIALPSFMGITAEEVEARRAVALRERLAKLPDYLEAIRKTRRMQPHTVAIVPIAE